MAESQEIELQGHIIDSGIMTQLFDRIMDMGGNFEILTFDVGKKKTDPSYARLKIVAQDKEKLRSILSELHRLGARLPQVQSVHYVPAAGDRNAPREFYTTTNHPTQVRLADEWVPVEEIEMDFLIVVDPAQKKARCTPLGKIRKGDFVVVGEEGVLVSYPDRPRTSSTFEFMHGTVSSERPSETLIAQIAKEILEVHRTGGKIILVGGPAIIHTGADKAVAEMVRKGYINVLFAGNALATHDVEYNLFGTSLGMDIKTGRPVMGGHRHHIYAISEIMRAGSLKSAVEQGILTGGIMYECVKHNVPFVPRRFNQGRRPPARCDPGYDGGAGRDAQAYPRVQDGPDGRDPPALDSGGQLPALQRKNGVRGYQPRLRDKTDGPGHDTGHRDSLRCRNILPPPCRADRKAEQGKKQEHPVMGANAPARSFYYNRTPGRTRIKKTPALERILIS